MKRFLLICIILFTAGSLVAQTPTVADLTTTSGSNIKWYAASTGGSALATSTTLVNGTTYYASQTVNGVESTSRLAVTATVTSCTPSVTTGAAGSIASTTVTVNGNITAINGANVTVRGFKYSTTNGFNPASAGTTFSESGTFSTGTFSANLTGLNSSTTYYVCAYGTNSAGTSYGSQVSFTTNPKTDFAYTGSMQSFTVPATGTYKLEVWGAQGGTAGAYAGGYGGYSTGLKNLTSGDVLNIYVGQMGLAPSAGAAFNGGGAGMCCGAGGGGGTDIRIGGTALNNRVIVAGGGGGGSSDAPIGLGGDGGGTSGANGTTGSCTALGGTQSSGYALGDGQSNTGDAAGGGGGYYGGYAGCDSSGGSGGGGSGYIGGVSSGSTISGQRSGDGLVRISLYIP
jgi:hypothetical protein